MAISKDNRVSAGPSKETGLTKLLEQRLKHIKDFMHIVKDDDYLPVLSHFGIYPKEGTPNPIDYIMSRLVWRRLNERLEGKAWLLIVEGEFGMGKTTLLTNAALTWLSTPQRTQESQKMGILPIFPVYFSQFPSRTLGQSGTLSQDDLKAGIISQLKSDTARTTDSEDERIWTQLLNAIHNGECVLALDGLDEFVQPHEFAGFIQCLYLLLDPRGHNGYGNSRVVVSIRSEFLKDSGYYGLVPLGQYLTFLFPTRDRMEICHLELKGFDRNTIELYLDKKLGNRGKKEFSTFEHLAELLKRPIMAWIYCAKFDEQKNEKEIKRTDIIHRYIKHGCRLTDNMNEEVWAKVQPLREYFERNKLLWDLDEFASKAKKHYEETAGFGNHFKINEIEECLIKAIKDIIERYKENNAENDVTAKKIRRYFVHKCPLITCHFDAELTEQDPGSQSSEQNVHIEFKHRIIYEYLAAYQVWEDAKRYKDKEDPEYRFTTFDDLVLKVDTRKFLRELAVNAWFDRTRRAYALDLENHEWSCVRYGNESKKEWADIQKNNVPCGKTLEQLDHDRCQILAMMTYPDETKMLTGELDGIASQFPSIERDSKMKPFDCIALAIDRFLEQTIDQKFMHPRYLVPNLEPIAQYLLQVTTREYLRGEQEPVRKLIGERYARFARVLVNCYKLAKDRYLLVRGVLSPQLREAYGLLLERCLSIGLRLRQPWVQEEVYRSHHSIDDYLNKSNPDRSNLIDGRIRQICAYIPKEPRWQEFRF